MYSRFYLKLRILDFPFALSKGKNDIESIITSGDTAFRAARLTIAEVFNLDQTDKIKRL